MNALRKPDLFLPLGKFEDEFRERFGRDMTAEERRLYELTRIILQDDPATERRGLTLVPRVEPRSKSAAGE